MIGEKKHGLLLMIEIHREELDFARKYNSRELLKRLKEAGHYPYSDLDRKPVTELEPDIRN
jgi:Suppressor of fused protein (SUFU)